MDRVLPRVLLAHNAYRQRGGEERAVAELEGLLRGRGLTVGCLQPSSARLDGARGRSRAALTMLRGGGGERAVAAAIGSLGADVLHAHNIHPLLGTRALAAARSAGAAVVLHLHNYRFSCAIGVAYRDGAPCFDCRGRDTLPGLRHRCRGSLREAAVYAVALSAHQHALLEAVDRFVAPSEAAAARLAGIGVPARRLAVVPNFVAAERFAERSAAAQGSYALFAGRLAPEKGAQTAISAARQASVPLLIAGAGPDEPRLRALARGADVRFAGELSEHELARARRGAAVALVPSAAEESFGYAALEAMADGLPVLASARGGLVDLVGRDATLDAGDATAWADALGALWQNPALRRERGEAGLARARARFGPEAAYERLLDVYAEAIECRGASR